MATLEEIKSLFTEQENRLVALLSTNIDTKIEAALEPISSLLEQLKENMESKNGYTFMDPENSPKHATTSPYRDDIGTEWSELYTDTIAGKVSQVFSVNIDNQDFKILALEHTVSIVEDSYSFLARISSKSLPEEGIRSGDVIHIQECIQVRVKSLDTNKVVGVDSLQKRDKDIILSYIINAVDDLDETFDREDFLDIFLVRSMEIRYRDTDKLAKEAFTISKRLSSRVSSAVQTTTLTASSTTPPAQQKRNSMVSFIKNPLDIKGSIKPVSAHTTDDTISKLLKQIHEATKNSNISKSTLTGVLSVFADSSYSNSSIVRIPPIGVIYLSQVVYEKGLLYNDGTRISDKDVTVLWNIAFGLDTSIDAKGSSSSSLTLQTHLSIQEAAAYKFPSKGQAQRADGYSLLKLMALREKYKLLPASVQVHLNTVLDVDWFSSIQAVCLQKGGPHLEKIGATSTSELKHFTTADVFDMWTFAIHPPDSTTYLKMLSDALYTLATSKKSEITSESIKFCEYASSFRSTIYISFLEHTANFKLLVDILNTFCAESAIPPVAQQVPKLSANIFSNTGGIKQDNITSYWDAFGLTYPYWPYLHTIRYKRFSESDKDKTSASKNPTIYDLTNLVRVYVDKDEVDAANTKTLSSHVHNLSSHAASFFQLAPAAQTSTIEVAPRRDPQRDPQRVQRAAHMHMLPPVDNWVAHEYSHLTSEDRDDYIKSCLPDLLAKIDDVTPYDSGNPLYSYKYDSPSSTIRGTDRNAFIAAMQDFQRDGARKTYTAPPPPSAYAKSSRPCFKEALKPGSCTDGACRWSHDTQVLAAHRKSAEFAKAKSIAIHHLHQELAILQEPTAQPPLLDPGPQPPPPDPEVDHGTPAASMYKPPTPSLSSFQDADELYAVFDSMEPDQQRELLKRTQHLAASRASSLTVRQGEIQFEGRPRS